jgi:hypothetical protein
MRKSEKEMELVAWHLLLEDDTYRLELPTDFYKTLIQRADELVLRQILSLEEWQQLKDIADDVYMLTLQGLEARKRDRVDTASIDLGIASLKSEQTIR